MISKSLRVSKKTEDEVYALVTENITFDGTKSNLCDYLHGVVEQVYVEEQDSTFLVTGRTGAGKSTFAALENVVLQPIIREITGRSRHLDFAKNVYWSGLDYVRGMQPIVLDVASQLVKRTEAEVMNLVEKEALLNEAIEIMYSEGVNSTFKKLKKLEEKYGYTTQWLDEAQDLNSMETMNTFNRELIKIKSGVREMNLIDTICIPNPWLLSPYIREEKVNTAFFVFSMRDRERGRAMRKVAIYDLSKYHRLMMSDGRYIRRLMVSPLRLIDKFKPALVGKKIPLFPPECEEWKTYKIMKKLATVKLPLQGIEKIEEKYGLGEVKKNGPIMLMCPKCNHIWPYNGRIDVPTCPNCQGKMPFWSYLQQYGEDWSRKKKVSSGRN